MMGKPGYEGGYYGRFSYDGKLVGAGKFIGNALCLYGGRDGEFHFSPRYQDQYNDGEFDEISDEEFEEFRARMDAKWRGK